MLIVSISRHVRGFETLAHFALSSAKSALRCVCLGCGAWDQDTIAPVSLLDGGEVDPDADAGAYLCRPCSMKLPTLREVAREEWPVTLTALEVERVWTAVRKEQAREVENEAARKSAIATCLEEINASFAATEKAIRDEPVNRVGKVA